MQILNVLQVHFVIRLIESKDSRSVSVPVIYICLLMFFLYSWNSSFRLDCYRFLSSSLTGEIMIRCETFCFMHLGTSYKAVLKHLYSSDRITTCSALELIDNKFLR